MNWMIDGLISFVFKALSFILLGTLICLIFVYQDEILDRILGDEVVKAEQVYVDAKTIRDASMKELTALNDEIEQMQTAWDVWQELKSWVPYTDEWEASYSRDSELEELEKERDELEAVFRRAEHAFESADERLSSALENQGFVSRSVRKVGPYLPLIIFMAIFLATPIALWIKRFILWFTAGEFISRVDSSIFFTDEEENAAGEIPDGESRRSMEVLLSEGQVGIFSQDYVQRTGFSEEFEQKTEWFFDSGSWFASLCSKLFLMSRYEVEKGEEGLKISSSQDETLKFRKITLGKGESIIVRTGKIAGVVYAKDERPRLVRHVKLFSLQAWITLQLIYYEVEGPCDLYVTGVSGVLLEPVMADGRMLRYNPDIVIGFRANLEYLASRSENMLQYIKGSEKLFNDRFRGEGYVIIQETARASKEEGIRKLFSGAFDMFLKLIGV